MTDSPGRPSVAARLPVGNQARDWALNAGAVLDSFLARITGAPRRWLVTRDQLVAALGSCQVTDALILDGQHVVLSAAEQSRVGDAILAALDQEARR